MSASSNGVHNSGKFLAEMFLDSQRPNLRTVLMIRAPALWSSFSLAIPAKIS
jgi:hypothetical protein